MRIAVFGTGGVGGYFGGRLAQAGEDVVFVARGEHLRAIRSKGLKVDSLNGDFLVYPAKATDDVAEVGAVDLVIVGVKAWQVLQAAHAMKPLVGPDTTVLPLQNGVEAPAQLRTVLGEKAVIGGLCKIVSFIVQPGHIRHAGLVPTIVVGELDNQRTARATGITEVFNRAGIETTIASDMEVALWTKFLFVSSFSGVGALREAPAGRLRTDPEMQVQLEAAMREVLALAHARNVQLPADAVAKAMASLDALSYEATSSMQRDIAAGLPSELESQSGAVVRMAREAGIEVPTHQAIYEKLRPLEEKARERARGGSRPAET